MPGVIVSLASWSSVVQKHLENVTLLDEEITRPDGSKFTARRVCHPSDPPVNFQESWGVKRPGPLPVLVDVATIPREAHTRRSDHSFVLDHPDAVIVDQAGEELDTVQHQLEHLAQVVVVEARRHGAGAVALLPPKVEGDATMFSVIMVLSKLEATKA